ncbi:MAG TPA: hypothetical protein VGD79_02565 [Thermoanaerobaculia bacterium]|jgi:hypothetical protein
MKRRESERGAALIIVIFASTLILLLLMTALTVTQTSNRTVARQLSSQGQAMSTANAGLTEGLSWFVRQRQQPVTNFDPVVDPGGVCPHVPAHDPAAYDSEDPATGIIRSFEITSRGRVWGRYEVRRNTVRDVSVRRGKTQAGTIWQLQSDGIVYVRNDAAKAPNVSPNFVLARRTMRVDIQRLALQLPHPTAALSAVRGNNINVTKPSRIQGGTAGVGAAYPASTGTPNGNGTITGNPARDTTATPFTIASIFGVTTNELISMADIVVDDESQLPNPLPDMALVVVRGNATFNGQRPLQGSGILVVLGNLILNPQSNAYFSGVVWVGGNFNMTPPGIINGSVVANGNAHLSGGSDVAEINYDSAILDQVRLQMGNYLFSRSPWVVTQ